MIKSEVLFLVVGCVVLNYNDSTNTLNLLDEIKDYSAIDKIILVDNCSTDHSWDEIQKAKTSKVYVCKTEKNGGYGYGNNFGVKYAEKLGCDAVLIVNPDVHFNNELVERLYQTICLDKTVGVASGIQLDANGMEVAKTAWRVPRKMQYIFSTGILLRKICETFYYKLEDIHREKNFQAECVAGSLLMISVPKFLQCGGYDEEIFLYCEETTLGYKMKISGYSTVVCSDITYYHIHGVSIQRSISSNIAKKQIMLQSHHLFLQRYLEANGIELILDTIVGKVVLAEEWLKAFVRRGR